ncbi:MAG: hypothetical protein NW205_00345 [Hyphomicrobiaceae bacterium]|nr:hypothetical protein [Hyphomicrobiaceae bacterium]
MVSALVITALVGLTIAAAAHLLSRPDVRRTLLLSDVPDRPLAFGSGMAWLAVRTEDGMAVASQLGIPAVQLANWNSGLGTIYDERLGAARLYITPPVKGWTFVVGLSLPHPVGPAFVDKLSPLLLKLGSAFPDVQYYFAYPAIDYFAWARVANGKIVRAFAVSDAGIVWNKGKISKEERALGLRLFELRGVKGRSGDAGGELVLYPTEPHVFEIARGWSVDPMQLGSGSVSPVLGLMADAPLSWAAERARKSAA